jgi:glycosyltransferase involved in cell wall biosynthesis
MPNLPTSNTCELTILMPCLNEAETLAICVTKALNFLKLNSINGEVLIADNGSTDGSQKIASSLGARVVAIPQKGYGAALIGGINNANGIYTIMGDSDDSYDFTALMPFVLALRGGADLVIGNRFSGGIDKGAMPFLHRYLGNPVLSFIGRLFFKIPVGDFHCGLRGFNTQVMRNLELKTTGMEFASEMIVRSALENIRIQEVPTTLVKDGRSRPPHLHTWRDGWRHLKFLLMHNPFWLFFVPGIFFLFIGMLIVGSLFTGPVKLGALNLDLNTYTFGCFMTIAGVQLIVSAGVTYQYAFSTGILPPTNRLKALNQRLTTDCLVFIGGIAIALGIGIFFVAISQWASVNFGDLVIDKASRIVILALSILVIGIQLFFSGFLIGILQIQSKRQ